MHVFITGGTRGIGLGLVKEFLKHGHRVSYTGTSESSINKHINELTGDFLAQICDVRDKSQIKKVIFLAKEEFGNIDIWINNAGVDQAHQFIYELNEEEIKRVIDINVVGTMLGTSAILKEMIDQGYGTVYNFEGLGSNNMVIQKTIVYGSSKRLIRYFSKASNKEIKQYKSVHVGTIQPGMVFTDLLLNNMDETGMKVARILGNEVPEVTQYIVSKILKGKRKISFPTYRKAIRNIFKKNKAH